VMDTDKAWDRLYQRGGSGSDVARKAARIFSIFEMFGKTNEKQQMIDMLDATGRYY
jgi:hypothetical protein